MTITKEQWERRRDRLGASDVPAVLGVCAFSDSYQVWASKTGATTWEDQQDEENEAADLGNDHEEGLIRFAERKLAKIFGVSVAIARNVEVRPNNSFMAANLDGLIEGVLSPETEELRTSGEEFRTYGVECKCTSMLYDSDGAPLWGDHGDEVPPRVVAQCQAQCAVAGLDGVYVAALLPIKGRLCQRLFFVPRDQAVIDKMLPKLREFWVSHVEARIAPEPTARSLELVQVRREREEGKAVAIPAGKFEEWIVVKKKLKDLTATEKGMRAVLSAAMGDSNVGVAEGSEREMTQQLQSRRSLGKSDHHNVDRCPNCKVGYRVSESVVTRDRKARTALPPPATEQLERAEK